MFVLKLTKQVCEYMEAAGLATTRMRGIGADVVHRLGLGGIMEAKVHHTFSVEVCTVQHIH